MILAHRIALDPTKEQSTALERACGVARFTWNWALAEWNKQYAEGKKPNASDLKKQWNSIKEKEFPWVYDSPKDANQQVFANLQRAWIGFFKKRTKRPTFKKKGWHDSFYVSNDKFDVGGKTVRLPIIGVVRMREEFRFAGKITAATVTRSAGRWFVSIQVDVLGGKLAPMTGAIGVDLGLKHTLVCSDGQVFDAPKPLRKNMKKLRRLSKRLAKKKKGSKNRKKAAKKLARLHARISNIRGDWAHKVTTKLIRENQVICLEDLNVRGMLSNRKLARSISDVLWAEIRRQCEYKAELRGREVKIVDRFRPTTKPCSRCGRLKNLSLSDRVYRCDGCGLEIDRDLNAAINICTAGLAGH